MTSLQIQSPSTKNRALSPTFAPDKTVGRYLQSDPMGLRAGIATFNYVGNNPANRTDHRGLSTDQMSYPVDGGMCYPVKACLTIQDQMPSSMPSSTPCPSDERWVSSSCLTNGSQWDASNWFDDNLYHGGMNVYKERHPSNQWGSECSYNNGQLVEGQPTSGTADLYPDWTFDHFSIDPGGPRINSWYYNNYWSTHPHPAGVQ